MTVQWSTTVRNTRMDAWETAIGVSPFIRFYSGTEPANCGAALSGNTLLAEFALASDWSANASGGAKTLSSLPLATTGQAGAGAGTAATFYRIYANDGTTCHEQGKAGATGDATADITLDNVSIASGQTVQITGFTKTEAGA